MSTTNKDVRLALRGMGVPVWQAAELNGISIDQYYRRIRHEWTQAEKDQFLQNVRNYIDENGG